MSAFKKLREQRGSGIIEFVLIFSFMITFTFTMISIAFAFQQRYELNDAIHDGLQYAVTTAVTNAQVDATCTVDCHKNNIKTQMQTYLNTAFLSGNVTSTNITITLPSSYKRGERVTAYVVVTSSSVALNIPFTFSFFQSEIIQQDPTS